jgi:hypothetical protein
MKFSLVLMSNECNVYRAFLYLEEFSSAQVHTFFFQLDFTPLVYSEIGVLDRAGINMSLFAPVVMNLIEPSASPFRGTFLYKYLRVTQRRLEPYLADHNAIRPVAVGTSYIESENSFCSVIEHT